MPRDAKLIAETKASLGRLQNFDPATLARTEDLGRFSFQDAVPSANGILELFKAVALDSVDSLSTPKLNQLKTQCDATFNQLDQFLKFVPDNINNPKNARDQLVTSFDGSYDAVFEATFAQILYSVRRSTDFSRLEREARAAAQSATDQADTLKAELEARKKDADAVLAKIREVAAEQGVSQKAIYFREEADRHDQQAKTWLGRVVWLAIGSGVFAIGSIFLQLVPAFSSTTGALTELMVSKILVFAVLATALLLSIRNFTAHQHNAVVNRHRQNSLVTFEALVEAAGKEGSRDVILEKAADSIFGAQPSGFSAKDGAEHSAFSMVNLASTLSKPGGG